MKTNSVSLEVVRGNSIGRRYVLVGQTITLGNRLNGALGIDLSTEEGSGPRKMSGRHALIERAGSGLSLRDLDTPGGTFVNRQRVLPGQARALQSGDVVQLGGVQLKLLEEGATHSKAPAPVEETPGFAFEVTTGVVCRNWDELLTAAAQRWSVLRDHLESGKLLEFVRSIGRPDLAPSTMGSWDERLDDWLANLPTTRVKSPVLDVVSPRVVVVKVAPGGGKTRRNLVLANVGYRLLKVSARIDPKVDWLAIGGDFAKGTVTVVESTPVVLEIQIPDELRSPCEASLILESNGGQQSILIRLEAAVRADSIPVESIGRPGSRSPLRNVSIVTRLIWCIGGACFARGLIAVANGLFPIAATGVDPPETPGMMGPLVLFALAGAGVGALWLGPKARSDARAMVPNWLMVSCALALFGVFLATTLVAICRTIETPLGSFGSSLLGRGLLWACLGLGLAGLSVWLVPVAQKGRAL